MTKRDKERKPKIPSNHGKKLRKLFGTVFLERTTLDSL